MKIIYQTSAGGIVFKKENNKTLWLVVQHSGHKGWVFPKGLVGDKVKNEPMRDAALREVEEEGGVKAKIVSKEPVKTFYQYRYQNELIKKSVFYFLMEYLSGNPKDHDWEVMEAKFIPTEKVGKTLTYPSDKQAFEKILQIYYQLHPKSQ